MNNVYLTLWIHGSAENPEIPCNEVAIFDISGNEIAFEFIDFIVNLSGDDIMMILKGLPVERDLKVHVLPICDACGWSFEVIDFKIDLSNE